MSISSRCCGWWFISAKFTGKNWLLSFGQIHQEFVEWFYEVFKEWTNIKPYYSVNCWRLNTRVIAPICRAFYPDAVRGRLGVKVVPSNIGVLLISPLA